MLRNTSQHCIEGEGGPGTLNQETEVKFVAGLTAVTTATATVVAVMAMVTSMVGDGDGDGDGNEDGEGTASDNDNGDSAAKAKALAGQRWRVELCEAAQMSTVSHEERRNACVHIEKREKRGSGAGDRGVDPQGILRGSASRAGDPVLSRTH